MKTEKINLIFPSKSDSNLFLEEVLPNNKAVTLDISGQEKSEDKYFLKNKQILKQDISAWQIISLLISGGTLPAIILSIKTIIIKYLESKTPIPVEVILEKNGNRVKITAKNKEQLMELLKDETIRTILVPEE